jgi:histidyl-tRNA synthetase
MLDFKIARGLDYYTGTVYETRLTGYESLGSVCGGGRYDNLADSYSNRKMPGVGISIGLTRLFYQLNEVGLLNSDKKSIVDAIIISMDEDISECLKLASALRNAGKKVDVYLENTKIQKKFKYVDKLDITYAIIIGEEERKASKYTLKNMATGEQKLLDTEEILRYFIINSKISEAKNGKRKY